MLTFKVGFEVFAVEFVVLHQLDWTSCSSGLMMMMLMVMMLTRRMVMTMHDDDDQ